MVGAIAGAGYAGIDLGPIGYLGTKDDLAERLGGLLLAGGWADLRYSDAEAFKQGLAALDATLDVFDRRPGRARAPGRPGPRSAAPARPRASPAPAGTRPGWRRPNGPVTPPASRKRPSAAATAATSPPSTTTSARTSRRPRTSSGCWS